MLELPEVLVLSRQVAETLKGRRVVSAVANSSPHGFAWYHGDPAGYSDLLTGRVVEGALPRAGQLEIVLSGASIVFCDGAIPRYLAPGERRPKKHQLLVEFDDGSGLYATVQMYGGMWAFLEGTYDNGYYKVACEKPVPYSDGFTYEYFLGIVGAAEGKLSAKALLATEQRIPGLGNGVLQDILFRARIHPKRKVSTLSGEDIRRLYDCVCAVPREMADAGGRDVEKDFMGRPGGYKTALSRLTVGKPCLVCGETIVKEAYLGGAVYYCPGCQAL